MTISTFTNTSTLLHANNITKPNNHQPKPTVLITKAANVNPSKDHQNVTNRRNLVATFFATSVAAATLGTPPVALAEKWGNRSFLWEHFFEPNLSPEDAVARIKQTAEGLHNMREMLDAMAWRYIMFYIRVKEAYLDQDLKNAMSTVPEFRQDEYVKTANELVDNIQELDRYIRTPKVYESYLYYEKTLKSIDQVVELLG